eukprot:5618154-Pyramimonas_sp.AAC.1
MYFIYTTPAMDNPTREGDALHNLWRVIPGAAGRVVDGGVGGGHEEDVLHVGAGEGGSPSGA